MANPMITNQTRLLQREAATAAAGLPALLAEAQRLSATLASGAHGRRRSGTGETFWQYRDYSTNDSASAIDWRQSARSPNRLFVRETEWETAATIRLWCEGLASFDYGRVNAPTKRRRAQVIMLAVAMMLARAGEHIGALPAAGPARGGSTAVLQLAESLIESSITADESGVPPTPIAKTTTAIFISDFYVDTEQLLRQIAAIAATGTPSIFIEVTDPTERDFPFEGHTAFHVPGSKKQSFRFGKPAAIRASYKAVRDAHRGAFKDQCRRFGFPIFSHVTDTSPGAVLSAVHNAVSNGVRQ